MGGREGVLYLAPKITFLYVAKCLISLAPRAGLPSRWQKLNEISYFCNRFDNPNQLNRDIEFKSVLPCGVKPPGGTA
jgi:hypothetical protein